MRLVHLLSLACAAFPLGCEPAYIDTVAPKDATFELSCSSDCGPEARDPGLVIDIRFATSQRSYPLCCEHRSALRARLQTVKDFWCDGLDVPQKRIGGLWVGTTTSEISGERGATIDDGEGYVAFNCTGWLDELIAGLGTTPCCPNAAAPQPAAQPAPPPGSPPPQEIEPSAP